MTTISTFITFRSLHADRNSSFTSENKSKQTIMSLAINNHPNMQLKTILNKINPWVGLIGSLSIIIPNLYDILDDPFNPSSKHLILAVGVFLMIIFLKEIFDRIINLPEETE